MIPELQSADHFEPISFWDAGRIFPIYAVDRFEQRREDGAISVAACLRARAQTTLYWAEQLMQAVGKEVVTSHPYFEGFTYTSLVTGVSGGAADWCISPFVMARCLQRIPPIDVDFDYTDLKFISCQLALALPNSNRELRPIYDPTCLDVEREPFFERLQQVLEPIIRVDG